MLLSLCYGARMAGKKKRFERFVSCPSDLTWAELIAVLGDLGYSDIVQGAGSRVKCKGQGLPKLSLHRPHNPPVVRQYVVRQVLEKLREEKVIP
jgi:hypothetical protein